MTDRNTSLLQEGNNCSSINHANDFGVLVDGEEYFAALRSALIKAKRRICILAWEFHSQTSLVRKDVADHYPTEIGELLNALLEEREELEVYILVWDYALIYLAEREWKIFSDWLNEPHPRLHLVSDKTAPNGASHHQKIVTIDDHLAFCGGLDISISRWDTCQHLAQDERRINPDGEKHDPYHDLHTAMNGEAATALRTLFDDRWKNATGDSLPSLHEQSNPPSYYDFLPKQFSDVDVAISKIQASPSESPTEVEQLHLDLFAAARKTIYIENQYFSSKAICDALAKRLHVKDGPQVVIILPLTNSGWLVDSTVGLLRDRLLELLKEADPHDRLRIYAPVVKDDSSKEIGIYVHAKLLIIDDRILKTGSSNLSNRSMRVDSECDLTLEFSKAHDNLRFLRQRLLGQHHGLSPEEWADHESKAESLVEALDTLETDSFDHYLKPLSYGCDSDLKRRLADTQLLDPEDPIDPEFLIQKNLSDEERPYVWKRVVTLVSTLATAALLGAGIYWLWGERFGQEDALAFGRSIAESPWSPLIAFAIFSIGGSIGIPLNFMLITTAIVMGSRFAITYGVTGALLSSVIGFYLGELLGKPLIRKFGSKPVDAVSRKLGERSFRSVAFIRLIPVAPFFIVNMVAGASQLKFKEYAIGTVLGMTPGMCAVVLLANRVEAAARQPGWLTFASLAVVVGLLVLLVNYLKKSLSPSQSKR